MTLDREHAPLLGEPDEALQHLKEANRNSEPLSTSRYEPLYEPCTLDQPMANPSCCIATDGHQLLTPGLNGPGVHTAFEKTSIDAVRKNVGEQISSFLEGLLIHDDRHDTREHLFAEDVLRLPWLRTLAKVASRDIHIFCIPVSELAGKYLKHELCKIKRATLESATFHGQTKWWLSDKSMQITGEERVQRLVTKLIRDETKSHAFDSTSRKKVPKHQKQHDHSIFRQTAQNFKPPKAELSAIANNESNHPVAASSRTLR